MSQFVAINDFVIKITKSVSVTLNWMAICMISVISSLQSALKALITCYFSRNPCLTYGHVMLQTLHILIWSSQLHLSQRLCRVLINIQNTFATSNQISYVHGQNDIGIYQAGYHVFFTYFMTSFVSVPRDICLSVSVKWWLFTSIYPSTINHRHSISSHHKGTGVHLNVDRSSHNTVPLYRGQLSHISSQ